MRNDIVESCKRRAIIDQSERSRLFGIPGGLALFAALSRDETTLPPLWPTQPWSRRPCSWWLHSPSPQSASAHAARSPSANLARVSPLKPEGGLDGSRRVMSGRGSVRMATALAGQSIIVSTGAGSDIGPPECR
jgi:hypothetical protein